MLLPDETAAIPLAAARWVAFDVETTGLSCAGDRVVEIGAVMFSLDGRVHEVYQQLVNPQRWIPWQVVNIHGITAAMVRDQPAAARALPGFLDFLSGAHVALAHNAGFDVGFIGMECARVGLPQATLPILDTVSLARRVAPGFRSYRLATLASNLGVGGGRYHRAVADSEAVREIFRALVARLPGASTIADVTAKGDLHYFRSPLVVTQDLPPGFELLDEALKAERALDIIYCGGRKGAQPRTITPRSLFRQGGYLHVSAYCHIDQREKHFRLDRIRQLVSLRD